MSNVSEITQHLISIVAANDELQDVWLQGKISNVNCPRNGNTYFTLKDNSKRIECVIFTNWEPLQENLPAAENNVSVKGQIYVYGTKSEYRFMVKKINLPEDPLPDQSVSVSTLINTLKNTLQAHPGEVEGEISKVLKNKGFTILKLKDANDEKQSDDIIECVLPPEIDPPFPLETGERVNVTGQFGIFANASAYQISIDDANKITPVTPKPKKGKPALNKCKKCGLHFSKLQDQLCHIDYDANLTSEGIVVGAVERYFKTPRFANFSIKREHLIHIAARQGRADVVLYQDNQEVLSAIAECKRIGYDGNSGIPQLQAYLAASGTTLGLFAADTDPYEWQFFKNLGRGSFDKISRTQFERELGVEQTPGIPPDKTRFELIHGNIIESKVDAIVTTASAQLARVAGVDGKIREAAGEEIDNECQEIIEREGFRPQGTVEITIGGNLTAKHIIHAIGPIFAGGKQYEAEALARCYENSLKVAVENGIGSIAFPAISTGNFGYPIEQATPIALNTVKEFVEQAHQNDDMVPECIQFVLFDEEAYNYYVKEFSKLGFGLSCLIG